jgi:hypothetical protein
VSACGVSETAPEMKVHNRSVGSPALGRFRDDLVDASNDRSAGNDRIDLRRDVTLLLAVRDIASGQLDPLGAPSGVDRNHLRVAVELAHHQMREWVGIEKVDAGLEPHPFPNRPGQRFVDRMIDKGAVAVVKIRNQDGDQPRLRSEIMIGEADRDVRPARYIGDLEIAVAVDQFSHGRRHDAFPRAAFAVFLAASGDAAGGSRCHLDS